MTNWAQDEELRIRRKAERDRRETIEQRKEANIQPLWVNLDHDCEACICDMDAVRVANTERRRTNEDTISRLRTEIDRLRDGIKEEASLCDLLRGAGAVHHEYIHGAEDAAARFRAILGPFQDKAPRPKEDRR